MYCAFAVCQTQFKVLKYRENEYIVSVFKGLMLKRYIYIRKKTMIRHSMMNSSFCYSLIEVYTEW